MTWRLQPGCQLLTLGLLGSPELLADCGVRFNTMQVLATTHNIAVDALLKSIRLGIKEVRHVVTSFRCLGAEVFSRPAAGLHHNCVGYLQEAGGSRTAEGKAGVCIQSAAATRAISSI